MGINCLITWKTSPWINFYLQRAHRPIFLHFHPWQKWAPLQSSAPRRKENWIQHHWKRSRVNFCFIRTHCVHIYIHVLGATVKLTAAITEIWKLIDGWNSSVFQICSCPLKHLKCFSPVKSSAKMHLKPHISIGHGNCFKNFI